MIKLNLLGKYTSNMYSLHCAGYGLDFTVDTMVPVVGWLVVGFFFKILFT